METLWMLLSGVVALGVVVFLHELGHFTLAKFFKIKVLTFSLGFGKKLVGFKRGETEYVISALPLGGYVKMAGENPQEADGQPARPGDFFYQAWWKRLAVTLAGPLMNWLSAALIFALVFWRGFEVPLALPQVVEVMPNSPAQASELLPGDVITALEEQPLLNWEKFETLLNQTMEKQQAGGLKLTIRRRGSEEKLLINPEKDPASKRWRIGIVMAPAATTIVD
jgi:regulator of sigma E protease